MSTFPLATPADDVAGPAARRSAPWARATSVCRKAVRGGAVYALGDQVVFSFGNMVVAALLSRHCAAVEFGVYILTQRAMDVLLQLSNGLLWTPLTFALPAMSRERRAQYQGSILLLQLCLCVLYSGVLWLAAGATAGNSHPGLHGAFQPLVFAGAGLLFREFTRRMYFAHLRLKEAFWTDVATNGLQIAGVAWLTRTGRLDVPRTLGVLSAAAVCVSLWWVVREWRSWTLDLRAAWSDLRQDLRMGRWLFGGNMVALASAQCNPWVLNAMLGSASVGAYSISESLVNIPRAALTSMQNVMGPLVARAHAESGTAGVQRSVARLNRTLLLVSAAFGVGIWAASPLLARAIYGSAPANTRIVASVLAVNLIAFTATLAQMYGLTALGRADATLYANLLGLLAQVGVCVFLVHTFQVPGAALALLTGNVAVLALRQWLYSRAIAVPTPAVAEVGG